MRFSETFTKVSAALFLAQKQITFAAADKENKHLKSKYADLASVIEAIKKPLNENGLLFIQSPDMVEGSEYALRLTTKIIHVESGEWVENVATIPLSKNDPQGYGSALTYARRYNLSALVGLYNEDDDGEIASDKKRKAEQAEPKVLPEYPQDLFDTNFPQWKKVIESKKKTAAEVIAMVSTKYTLTKKQIDQIELAGEVANEVADVNFSEENHDAAA